MSVEKKFKETPVVFAAVRITYRGPDLNVRLAIPKVLPNDTVFNTASIQDAIDQCDRTARGVEPGMNRLELEWLAKVQVEIETLWIRPYWQDRRYPLPEPLRLPSIYHSLKRLDLESVDLGDRTEFLTDLTDLEGLGIDNCGLTRVPPQIEHMKKLESLALALCNIQSIPLFLGYMPRLISLMVYEEPRLSFHEIPLSVRGIWYVTTYDSNELPSEILYCQHRLGILLLNGLVEADKGVNSPWTRFLRQGMYDPRLFLHIWAFVPKEEE